MKKIMNIKELLTITSIALLSSSLVACSHDVEPEKAAEATQVKASASVASQSAPYLTRDIQDEVFYFVMPDRFNNGDTDNDLGSKTKVISSGGFDPTDKGGYHGGDIKGLADKLPYLEDLGITAIWLTPILRNKAVQDGDSGYHGYWVLDFTEIDPHLGSNEDLKNFIDAAHKRNIKVFFDIITNHTADVIKYPECHGEDGKQWLVTGDKGCPYKTLAEVEKDGAYKTIIPKGEEQVKFPAWLNDPKYYHNQGDTTFKGEDSVYGDFAGLDDINTDDPVVVKGMIDIFEKLVKQFRPDGFRIDTVKHVNIEFWQQFAPAIVAYANSIGLPKFFMFAEVYSFEPEFLSQYTTEGKVQSVLDFAFQGAVAQALVEQKGTDVLAKLFAQDKFYQDQDSDANQLLNFVGNHDMGRFAYILNNSEYNYSEDQQIKRTLLAHALAYFARGIPIVYYGAEQGFIGDGNDKDSRQDMMPSKVVSYNDDNVLATEQTTADDNFDKNHPFYQAFAQYAHVYQANPALRYGQQETVYAQDKPGVFAFTRNYQGKQVLAIFNTANAEQSMNLEDFTKTPKLIYQEQEQGNKAQLVNGQLQVNVPALSFVLYQVK